MTDERDRLQFDVVLDLKTAEAEILAFQKRFDKPLVLKVTLDTKPALAELKTLEKEAQRVTASIKIKVDSNPAQAEVANIRGAIESEGAQLRIGVNDRDVFADIARIKEFVADQHAQIFVSLSFNEEAALRDIEGFKRFVEEEVGQIDFKGDFDFPRLAEQVRLAVEQINARRPTIKVRSEFDGPTGAPPPGTPGRAAPPAPAPAPIPPFTPFTPAAGSRPGFFVPAVTAEDVSHEAKIAALVDEANAARKRGDADHAKELSQQIIQLLHQEEVVGETERVQKKADANKVKIQNNLLRLIQMRGADEAKIDREAEQAQRNILRLMEERVRDEEKILRVQEREAAKLTSTIGGITRSDPRALPTNLAPTRDEFARLRIESDRGRISADQLDKALRRVAAASGLEAKELDRAAAAAKLLAIEQKKLDAAAAKSSSGGGGGGGAFGESSSFVTSLGRFLGKGQEARGLVAVGGIAAAGTAAVALLAFELAKLPIEVAKLAESFGKTGIDIAKFGIESAIELEPLLNAIEGITSKGPSLKDLFGGEQTNIKAIFGDAFLQLGRQVSVDLFGPVNNAIAKFVAGIAPHFAPIVTELAPVFQQLGDQLAGNFGDRFGKILEKIGGAVAKLLQNLNDPRVFTLFDIFGAAIDKALPGIQGLIDGMLEFFERSKDVQPILIEIGSDLLIIAGQTLGSLGGVLAHLETPLKIIDSFLTNISLLLKDIDEGLPRLTLGFNNLNPGLRALLSGASVGLIPFNVSDADVAEATRKLSTVHAEIQSTSKATDEFAEHLKKVGASAAEITSFEEFNSSLQKLVRFGLAPIPKNVQAARDRILELIASAQDGSVTFNEFQQQELEVLRTSHLETGEINLLTKALQEQQKVLDKDTKEQEKFQAALDKVNETLSGEPIFASATVNAIAFAAAVSDGTVTLDEFNAVVTQTGLSSKEVEGVFTKIAKGMTEVRTALDKMLPSFDSALKNIDLTKIKFGRSFEAVLGEIRKQVGDTAFFFNDIDKAIARGRINSLRLILTSGATKQEQERFVHELAVGGDSQTAELERQATNFSKATAGFEKRIQDFGSVLGAPVIEGLSKDIPGALAKINSFADQVQAEALKRFAPGNPDNIKLAHTIQEFFASAGQGGIVKGNLSQTEADDIVKNFKRLQTNLAATLTPEQVAAFDVQATNIATAASTAFSTELKTELPKAIDEVGKTTSEALSNVEVHPKITVDIKAALTSIAVVAQLLNLTDKNIAMPKIVIPIEDALLSIAVVAELIALLDQDSATVDVFIDYSDVTSGVDTVTTILGELNGSSATVKVQLDRTAFDRTYNEISAALDALQNRKVTVDIIANVIQTATTRKDGGPVLPGFGYTVNDGGFGREGLLDDRGFQMLPPGGYQTFDRPGIIIPARDVHRFEDRVAAPSHVSTSVASHSESVTHNSPTIVVNGSGRDPMLFAKRVVAMLP